MFHATNLLFSEKYEDCVVHMLTFFSHACSSQMAVQSTENSTVAGGRVVMCMPTLSEWLFLVQVCSYLTPIVSKVHPAEE